MSCSFWHMLRIKSFVNKYILLQAFVIAITACLASINTESFHMSPCAGATIAAQKQSHHDCGMLQHRRCYNYTYDIIHIAGVINKNKPDQYVRGLLITWVTWVQLFVFIQQLSDNWFDTYYEHIILTILTFATHLSTCHDHYACFWKNFRQIVT